MKINIFLREELVKQINELFEEAKLEALAEFLQQTGEQLTDELTKTEEQQFIDLVEQKMKEKVK